MNPFNHTLIIMKKNYSKNIWGPNKKYIAVLRGYPYSFDLSVLSSQLFSYWHMLLLGHWWVNPSMSSSSRVSFQICQQCLAGNDEVREILSKEFKVNFGVDSKKLPMLAALYYVSIGIIFPEQKYFRMQVTI
uniref:Integrase_H2C2 domain-containing protein n=1 Tax=Caenorhabditis tropicalis TaxID=1561998 RepID=A0A1I7TYI0_9PELO